MPLDTYARNLAVQLTGRERWSATGGPEAFAGRDHMALLCDLAFKGQSMLHRPLIAVENVPFKRLVGLSEQERFFSCIQLGGCVGIQKLLFEYQQAREANSDAQPTPDQRHALAVQSALERVSLLVEGDSLPIIPNGPGKTFKRAGVASSDRGAEPVGLAWAAFGKAYADGGDLDGPLSALRTAIAAAGTPDTTSERGVSLELIYNRYHPWIVTSIAYGLALVFFGLSTLTLGRLMRAIALVCTLAGVLAHIGGLGLRIAILNRAPVSNTYEALLWMGLVAMAVGLIAQLINRRAWYFVAGVAAAMLSVLFATLVPLESQTGSIPAVLRSNYWLIIHVLTITASYGVLAVASILSHVYLFKDVLLKRGPVHTNGSGAYGRAHPLVAQTYRAIQLGLVLLTAGTILGGVWAADSWGRFWGWDPKETWALISILVYFIILHARYLRWLLDFGMAACGVLAFASIVWTFYGVNYLMASGLHSYGFGSGGGFWVGVWLLAEIVFVGACAVRRRLSAPSAAAPAGAAASSAGEHIVGAV